MSSIPFDTIDTNEPNSELQTPNDRSDQGSKIATFLRWCGSILVILSALSFLLQGTHHFTEYRHWIALALTVLLCSCGVSCAYLFKETKGARVFFALGTGFLVVQVSQISAMLYSYLHDFAPSITAAYTVWDFGSLSPITLFINVFATTIIAAPIVYMCFTTLARKYRSQLTTTFVVGSVLLVLPIRDPQIVPIILAALLLVLRHYDLRYHSDSVMQLREGLAARALTSIPALILLGRGFFYPDPFTQSVLTLGWLILLTIVDIHRYTRSRLLIFTTQMIGTLASLALWVLLDDKLGHIVTIPHTVELLPVAAILFALASHVNYYPRLYRVIASVIALYAGYSAMLSGVSLSPILSIASGIGISMIGIHYREKTPLLAGGACILGGLLFYCQYAVLLYDASPWLSSIALGLGVLILASYIETKERVIRTKSRYYFDEIKTWA